MEFHENPREGGGGRLKSLVADIMSQTNEHSEVVYT